MFLDHWPGARLAQTSFPDPKAKKPMLFGTVQQKWRLELQKPTKAYGFICFSRRPINFIGTVQQKWRLELQKQIKAQGFIGFSRRPINFIGTVQRK